MISLQTILSERAFETYFVQVIIKMKKDANFTEIYNQIRGIKDVVVVKVIDTDRLDALSTGDYKYTLLEMKYMVSDKNPINTVKRVKSEALRIPGLVQFQVRTKTMLKIRNY
jgi:hypothetical protein